MKSQVIVKIKMRDLFEESPRIFFWPEVNNLVILNPPTLFFFATLEGSNGRKLAVNIETVVEEHGLIEIGEL